MKQLAAAALSLSLLALGCGKAGREGAAAGTGKSPASPVQDPQADASSRSDGAVAEEHHMPFVRIAELEIDPAQLESYKAAVKGEMEMSVRVEPGVLAIYAVAEKDNPSKLWFFEMYADEAAYRAHIEFKGEELFFAHVHLHGGPPRFAASCPNCSTSCGTRRSTPARSST